MTDSNKLWVIDLGDEIIPEQNFEKQPGNMRPVAPTTNGPRPAAKRAVRKDVPRASAPVAGPSHFALKLALTYLLGPFALVLWSRSRSRRPLAAAAVLSGLGCGLVAWKWPAIVSLNSSGTLFLPLVALTGILAVAAFSCWALALRAAFESRTRSHTALPGWMRSAWGVTGLGLIAPGLGLFLNGHRKRAVAALWAMWPVFPALVILGYAHWTWEWLQGPLPGAPAPRIMEYLIAGSVAVLVLAYLGWLTQALSGLYFKSRRGGIQANPHGDRYALALLAAVITLAVALPPSDMASFLHDNTVYLDQQGFQFIPLQMARAAHTLAPGKTEYSQTLALLEGGVESSDAVADTPRDPMQGADLYYGMLTNRQAQPRPEAAASTEVDEQTAAKVLPVLVDPRFLRHDLVEPQ